MFECISSVIAAAGILKSQVSLFTFNPRTKTCISGDTERRQASPAQLGFHLGISWISTHASISECSLIEVNKQNITFHCQQGVAMTTSHWCHSEWVTLIEQHRLRYPTILLLSPETATSTLSPSIHLSFWKRKKKKSWSPNSEQDPLEALIHRNL